MLINNISSSVNHYFPLGQIKGFDQISPDVMECIGEYAGCLAPQDQPSWSVYRNTHYFHALFKPRIHEERRRRIEQWENELNTGFSLFQNYKKTIDFSEIFYDLTDENLKYIINYRIDIGNTNALTLREYWLDHLIFRKSSFPFAFPVSFNLKNDVAIRHILEACLKFDPENNGGPKSLVPMRHLREMAQSIQETTDTDIAYDLSSHEVQTVTMRNIQSHSCFKKLSSCCLGVCLIAIPILNVVCPENSRLLIGAILINKIKVLGPTLSFPAYLFASLILATRHHGPTIHQHGIRDALLCQKKKTAACIKYIWHTRELLTDVLIKGIAAHMSIAMKSMGRAIRRLQ